MILNYKLIQLIHFIFFLAIFIVILNKTYKTWALFLSLVIMNLNFPTVSFFLPILFVLNIINTLFSIFSLFLYSASVYCSKCG